MFKQKAFLQHVQLEGGKTNNQDNDIIQELFDRIGANIMGKRMFEEGEANWPEISPFHCPVFVLTKEKREPWVKPGGTTFYFTNEDLHSVLQKAKESAASGTGNKDVRISGGADVIMQFLNAGLINEFVLHIVPMVMDKGVRLFENVNKENFSVKIVDAINFPMVTHLFYKVINNKS